MTETEFNERIAVLKEQAKSLGVRYCSCGHVSHTGTCPASDYGALPCVCLGDRDAE